MAIDENQLQFLLDRAAISDVLIRYATGVDTRDWPLLRSCFTDEIETGRLKVLLPKYEPRPEPIHAIYPSRRFVPQKTRVMIDFLEQRFALDPTINPPKG